MERKFVPVEKRGGGDANVDNDVPAHLRNDFPHSGHTVAKTKDNGRCKQQITKFHSTKGDTQSVIHLLCELTSILLMQGRHQAVAWQPHPSLFQPKLVETDNFSTRLFETNDFSTRLFDSDQQLLTPDSLVCCFDLSVYVM